MFWLVHYTQNENENDNEISFCDIDDTDGNYEIDGYLFYFSDSDYYEIYLNNITVNTIYGDTLFQIYSSSGLYTNMNNIYINMVTINL